MLEESDIKKLSEVFITRADLKHESAFINKQLFSIEAHVKQTDARAYKQGEDIQELKETTIRIAEKVSAMNEHMETFVTKDHFDARLNAIITGIDAIAGGMSDLRMEYVAIKMQQNRHEERLVQLEK